MRADAHEGVTTRPSWVPATARLVAVSDDVVSGQKFHLWYHEEAEPTPTRRFARRKTYPYLVERIATGTCAATLGTWEDACTWHAREVIAPAWREIDTNGTSPGA